MLYVITQDGLGIIPVPKYTYVEAKEIPERGSGLYRISKNGQRDGITYLGTYTGKDQAQRVMASLAGAMAGANRKMMVFTMPEDKKE
jgi:hypothetical protein